MSMVGRRPLFSVMAGLVPAIHAGAQRVDPRVKPGDDGGRVCARQFTLKGGRSGARLSREAI
ncbi:hypothetical protein SLNSH_01435 [Alsobacter soli]|uniref:Uncharacterized protein n=1 Tax=Alsobacter soli TaxID=2109933 RepID=A0A2T1HZL2_9HYPH|nr:hypothetical protein SLNSH_01435 [Alsobacter soli]